MDKITTTDLMQPRIKVIADFWDNPFKVGEIIEFCYNKEYHDRLTGEVLGTDWYTDFLPNGNKDVIRYMYALRNFTYLPHLFELIPWWEKRKVEDMPEYVKSEKTGQIFKPAHFLNSWAYPNQKGCTFNGEYYSYNKLLPASLEEYNEYQKQNHGTD